MKNIHLIQTEKPSKLVMSNQKELWFNSEISCKSGLAHPQHLYITSSEEIKEGDWLINIKLNNGEPFKKDFKYDSNDVWYKKIILTTDPDLIKGGVQAIDDEFLQWFVKNPGCEEVEVNKESRCCGRCDGINDLCYTDTCCDTHQTYGCEICYGERVKYKIIISKEKPKQEYNNLNYGGGFTEEDIKRVSLKQETLEEAAEKFRSNNPGTMQGGNNTKILNAFKNGAKWQQERSYSEEDINKIRELLVQGALTDMSCSSAIVEFDLIIKSLSQPKVFDVEVEMDFAHTDHVPGGFEYFPAITNNQIKITRIL